MIKTLFYIFSSLALLCATMVIRSKNPVHSVLFLILTFCNVSGLMLLVDLDFFAMLFLIVYVGAIAVLFLFVVMMLDIRQTEIQENVVHYLPIGGFVGIIFFLEMYVVLDTDFLFLSLPNPSLFTSELYTPWAIQNFSTIESIGALLYTTYAYSFIMASLILLVAMIGAIVLTLDKSIAVKRQDVYSQNSRDAIHTIYKIREAENNIANIL